ncbi:MAG: hypothetical protein AAFR61_13170, partial [Bacteroidota bacterium]
MKPPPPYFPFAPLLEELRAVGFRLGPDVYIRLEQLLNLYASREEQTAIPTLRYQMGALIAHSEEELRIFYEIFDVYVDRHAYFPAEINKEEKRRDKGRLHPAWYLLYSLPLLALLILWVSQSEIPDFKISLTHTEQFGREQTLTFGMEAAFEIGMWNLLSPPEIDSQHIEILYGESEGQWEKWSNEINRHHYEHPGRYDVKVRIPFKNGESKEESFSVDVKAIQRINSLSIGYERLPGNDWKAYPQSNLYNGEPKYRPWDTIFAKTYTWKQAGRILKPNSGDTIYLSYNQQDTISIGLSLTAEWRDTTVQDSQTQTLLTFKKPAFPIFRSKSDYYNPNLSHLIIQPETGGYGWIWFWSSLILTYIIYEFSRRWQRKVVLEETPLRSPPLQQPLIVEPPTLDFFQGQSFFQLARSLRRRRSGSQRPLLDLFSSIQKTAEQGGFPELNWKVRSQASQYLLLVEQKSNKDHLARLMAEIGHELESRDISIEVYFFDREPRFCWRKRKREAIPIDQLVSQFPDYRLLIIGEGEGMLDAKGQQLASWVLDKTGSWQERAWLSTKATESWGLTENALAREFMLVPLSQAGLQSLVEQWMSEEPLPPAYWQRNAYEIGPPTWENPDWIIELRAYLGEAGLYWLAAFAWYPEVSWALSLRMILRMEHMRENIGGVSADLDGLIRLFRLPWMREGRMTLELREVLSGALPEPKARVVREMLLEFLKQERNLPPKDSYAAADRQVRMALFTYLNSAQDAEARSQLEKELRGLDPEDIEDQFSLRELGKLRSPLSLILPARFFRGRVPFFGLTDKWRRRLIGTPLIIGLLIAFFIRGNNQPLDYNAGASYSADKLQLNSWQDSALWVTHEGFLRATDSLDPSGTGVDLFTRAYNLLNFNRPYQTSVDQALLRLKPDSLLHNYFLSKYHESLRLYMVDSLRQMFIMEGDSLFEINKGLIWRNLLWHTKNLLVDTREITGIDSSFLTPSLKEILCKEVVFPTQKSIFDNVRSFLFSNEDFLRLIQYKNKRLTYEDSTFLKCLPIEYQSVTYGQSTSANKERPKPYYENNQIQEGFLVDPKTGEQ